MLELILDVKFTDATLVEPRGNYNTVKRIFDQEPVGSDNWMLVSNISILWQTEPENPFPMSGFFEAKIHAHQNGDMVLNDCMLPKGISRDIEVFSSWAQLNHWNRPKLDNDLAKASLLQWKHYWDTALLDCEVFSKKYGDREELQNYIESDNDNMLT